MRRVILLVLLLLVSVAGALWLEARQGFVLLRLGELTVQASLFVAALAVIVAGVLIWLAVGLLQKLFRAPGRVRGRWQRHRRVRANRELVDGLIEMAEGRYAAAERHLQTTAEAASQPVVHHLLAALAAHRQGDWTRRDQRLADADLRDDRARVAVNVVKAQLQVDAGQWEEALATLGWLRERAPGNPRVLMLLTDALQAVGDEQRLIELLPDLRRSEAIDENRLASIERRAFDRQLTQLGVETSADALERVWKGLPRSRRRDPHLQARFARALIAADCPATAEKRLRRWLKRRWEPALVEVFGELRTDPPEKALQPIAEWLQQRPDDPVLLLAAGRQALAAEHWGQARNYLEAAVARGREPAALRLLADLYERLGEQEHARRTYRQALGMDGGEPLAAPASDGQNG
jgi:HemY protein